MLEKCRVPSVLLLKQNSQKWKILFVMLVLSPMCHLQTTIPSCRPVPETKGLFENLKMFDKRYARYNLACRDLGDEDYEWLDVPR
mgnify:CR=1 FL=1